jgi:Amt family ammonium transporter
MWCLRYFISRCFAIDGGLLTVVDLKQEFRLLSIFNCSMGNGRFFIVLFILKKTMGLRGKEEEIDGLDIHEHGTNAMTNP